MLKTAVEFQSSAFSSDVEQNENEANKCTAQTRQIAHFIFQQIQNKLTIESIIYPEDWGYEIAIHFSEKTLYLCMSIQEDREHAFLFYIQPHTPIIKRWFRKDIDITDDLNLLIQVLTEILNQHPEIENIKWMTNEAFNHPHF